MLVSDAPQPAQAIVAPAENKYSAKALRPRIREMVDFTRLHTVPADVRQRDTLGPHFRTGWGGSPHHCGDYWKILSDLKPAMVSGDLKVSVSSRNPEATQNPTGEIDHAESLEHYLNRTIVDTGLTETLDQICDTRICSYGCARLELEDIPGTQSTYWAMQGVDLPRQRVKISSVDPGRFMVDKRGDLSKAKMMGDWDVYSVQDVLEEAAGRPDAGGWNLDAVRKAAGLGLEDSRKDSMQDPITNTEIARDDFVCYRVWCKQTGMVHWVAYSPIDREDEGVELRKPVEWTGHRRGPYVVFGLVWVKNNPLPCPITALAERTVRMNDDTRRKIKEDAESYKRVVMMMGQKALKKYQKAKNGDGLNGDPTKTKEFTSGGIQPETLEHVAFLNSDIETMFGLSQVRQGNVGDESTATANAIAESAASVRRKYFEFRFRCCTRELMVRIAYFGWTNERIEENLTVPDKTTGELGAYTYYGGVAQDEPAEFDDVEADIDIEPYTAGLTDSAAMQRSMEAVGLILVEFTELVMNNPLGALIVNWENWLDDRMAAANAKGGGRRYINYPVVKALLQMQIMSMVAGGGPMGQAPGIGQAPAQPGKPARPGSGGKPTGNTGASAGGQAGQQARSYASDGPRRQ